MNQFPTTHQAKPWGAFGKPLPRDGNAKRRDVLRLRGAVRLPGHALPPTQPREPLRGWGPRLFSECTWSGHSSKHTGQYCVHFQTPDVSSMRLRWLVSRSSSVRFRYLVSLYYPRRLCRMSAARRCVPTSWPNNRVRRRCCSPHGRSSIRARWPRRSRRSCPWRAPAPPPPLPLRSRPRHGIRGACRSI